MSKSKTELTRRHFYFLTIVISSSVLLKCLTQMKGSKMYMYRLVKGLIGILEEFGKHKYDDLYEDKEKGWMVAEFIQDQMLLFERILYVALSILRQPEEVRKRFNTDLENLTIRYGTNMFEMDEMTKELIEAVDLEECKVLKQQYAKANQVETLVEA